MHFFPSTLMLKNNYSNYVLIVNLIHILLRTSRKPRPLSYESIVVIGKPHVSYRNAASENLMKKFRTRFVLFERRRRNGISVCKASRCSRWLACSVCDMYLYHRLHTFKGWANRQLFEEGSPRDTNMQLCADHSECILRANSSMNWRTLLDSLFNPRFRVRKVLQKFKSA